MFSGKLAWLTLHVRFELSLTYSSLVRYVREAKFIRRVLVVWNTCTGQLLL